MAIPQAAADTLRRQLSPSTRYALRNARDAAKIRRTFGYGHRTIPQWLDAANLFLRPKKTILFYPDAPHWISNYVAFRLCALAGYKVVHDPDQPYDVVFTFHDDTYSNPADLKKGIPDLDRAINGRCLDISKRFIEEVFEEIFGYALRVDPTQYSGPAVVKSDDNYTHDGRIVQCPIPESAVENSCVYQKAIDARTADGIYADHRVIVHEDRIPVMYMKYSDAESRFSNDISHGEIVHPEDMFSDEEIVNILAFASAMHLDFGELDVLRDAQNGRIYVVDVANTPAGPSNGFTIDQVRRAYHSMEGSFDQLIERYSR